MDPTIVVSRNSWHYKLLYRFWASKAYYRTIPRQETLCHYFWTCVLRAPLMWFFEAGFGGENRLIRLSSLFFVALSIVAGVWVYQLNPEPSQIIWFVLTMLYGLAGALIAASIYETETSNHARWWMPFMWLLMPFLGICYASYKALEWLLYASARLLHLEKVLDVFLSVMGFLFGWMGKKYGESRLSRPVWILFTGLVIAVLVSVPAQLWLEFLKLLAGGALLIIAFVAIVVFGILVASALKEGFLRIGKKLSSKKRAMPATHDVAKPAGTSTIKLATATLHAAHRRVCPLIVMTD